jgi:hypothetical protein
MKKQVVAALFVVYTGVCYAQTNIFESNGNVGIGTNTPLAKLDVLGGIDMAAFYPIRLVRGDENHGLRYKSHYNETTQLDGPFLYGYYGGSLGTKQGQNEQHLINWTSAGNVGIGMYRPYAKLDVRGDIFMSLHNNASLHHASEQGSFKVGMKAGDTPDGFAGMQITTGPYQCGNGGMLQFFTWGCNISQSREVMRITEEGSVGIGIASFPLQYKLAVAGKMIADELKVKPHASGWPDYVFKPGYKLMPLKEIESFIGQKGHLPEVPSAEQVAKEGIELGANQALLLRKIEEMTLHLISINKRVEDLEAENKLLKKQLEKALVK